MLRSFKKKDLKKLEKNKNLSKVFCIASLIAAFIYGLVLPFCWGNNPASESGTLSLLCEDKKIWFWIWGILTSGSIILNTQFNILIVCAFMILATFLVIFAVVGKSALMEMVPIAMMEVFLFVINFTPLVKVSELK